MLDRTGISPIRMFAHVKITNPTHGSYGQTGTVVRIDNQRRIVWVALPDGNVVPTGRLSIEVLVPRPSRTVE